VKDLKTVTVIGPVVWGSVWGHGPELARYLSDKAQVYYFNPLVPPKPITPSFVEADAYPVPEGVTVTKRSSCFSPGVLYGLEMEWKNLQAALSSNPDCLVTYYPLGSILALVWCRLKGKRSLFVYADLPRILRHRLARFLARKLGLPAVVRLATAGCVATSHLLYQDLRKISPKCILVPNGVNLKELTRRKDKLIKQGLPRSREEFTAGFVGYFGEWVDFELIFDTARLCPRINFLFVGDGPKRRELEERSLSLDNVHFKGPVPHREVFNEIAGMDICLIPFKVNELTNRVNPVKLFEYWAMGKPVLATGCLELQHLAEAAPKALKLFSSPDELASCLESLRQQPQLLAEASGEALRVVRRYDWQKLGAEIVNFILGESSGER